MMRLVNLTFVIAVIAGCATPRSTPEDCRGRAEAEYRRCLHPVYVPAGEVAQPTRSDQSQACREAYQQAIRACGGGGPEAPVPEIGTSTSARR